MPGNLLLPTEPIQLPLLPLRDVVVFPHMVMPLFVGRPKSIKALEAAMETGKSILLVAQKTASKDEPTALDLYAVGCIANILQMLKLPDGTVKVLVEGTQRAEISQIEDSLGYFNCEATPQSLHTLDQSETEALKRAIVAQFDQYVKLNKKIPQEILASLSGIDDASRLADTICAHLPIKLDQKQHLLEMADVIKRLESLLGQLESEIDILQVEKRIRGRVKRQMEKSQREYYLNEQVKAIQKELGEGEEGADLDELEKKIKLPTNFKFITNIDTDILKDSYDFILFNDNSFGIEALLQGVKSYQYDKNGLFLDDRFIYFDLWKTNYVLNDLITLRNSLIDGSYNKSFSIEDISIYINF